MKLSFFTNLGIRFQILAICLFSLLGFIAVGGVYLISNQVQKGYLHTQDEARHVLELEERIDKNLLNARRREKDFLLRQDEKYVGQHAETMAKINQSLSELEEHAQTPEVAGYAKELKGLSATYEKQFATVVRDTKIIGLNEKEGLQGKLRGAVHNVEERLKSIENDKLTVLMLMMRRHEKDFLLRLDPKYIGRIGDRIGEFKTAMKTEGLAAGDEKEITDLLGTYQAAFNELAALKLSLEEDQKKLSTVYAEGVPALHALEKVSTSDYENAKQQTLSNGEKTTIVMAAVILITAIIVFVIGWWISNLLSRPIQGLTSVMEDLTNGNRDVHVPNTEATNELGQMANSVLFFKDQLVENERLNREQQTAQQEQLEKAKTMRELIASFDTEVTNVIAHVDKAIDTMAQTAPSMRQAASEVKGKCDVSAQSATRATENVQTVATASEELSASIKEIGRQVEQSTAVTQEAVQQADSTRGIMSELAESTTKIGEVVGLITDIAEQTNLLALNATIEAARAGEAGKGFAVVASEVKNLSNQTSKATDEIALQINGVQAASMQAAEAITNITTTIQRVHEIASAIAAAVQEQAAATSEIARSVEETAGIAQSMRQDLTETSDTAQSTEQAAGNLLTTADDLTSQSNVLSSSIQTFLGSIRSAG
ncbi:methyl-accepting chemotaxis protein [Kiloniella majae]|uniref:methyl-accepting chemotaxis protein n=1 Tax=Kiloniella majae TaxID=1938558 RepID=UPI000A278ADA|nr:methyl-accepting chemotaxis protein [Kiloniella majae]